MNKTITEIKYEFFNITKLVQSIDLMNNFVICKVIKTTNKKASYIVESSSGVKFFLKAKLINFVNENDINIYKLIKNKPRDGINKIVAIYKTKKFLLVLSEYIDGIDMSQIYKTIKSTYSIREHFMNSLQNIFHKLVSSIYHLHSIGIYHCDISPSNIMVKNIGNDYFPVLIDYDLSKTSQISFIVAKHYGTIGFISPECEIGIIHKTTDVWNLGVVFYIFIFDKGFDPADLSYNIRSYTGQHKKIVSLLEKMLNSDPYCRITIEELYDNLCTN